MDKKTSRVVDVEELKSLSLVGGSDSSDGNPTPYSLQTSIITILVTALSISQIASAAGVCSDT